MELSAELMFYWFVCFKGFARRSHVAVFCNIRVPLRIVVIDFVIQSLTQLDFLHASAWLCLIQHYFLNPYRALLSKGGFAPLSRHFINRLHNFIIFYRIHVLLMVFRAFLFIFVIFQCIFLNFIPQFCSVFDSFFAVPLFVAYFAVFSNTVFYWLASNDTLPPFAN